MFVGGGAVGGGGEGGLAYAAVQTTVLLMKRLNQTESPIFVILCVLCFQRQSFLTFIVIVAIPWLFSYLYCKSDVSAISPYKCILGVKI